MAEEPSDGLASETPVNVALPITSELQLFQLSCRPQHGTDTTTAAICHAIPHRRKHSRPSIPRLVGGVRIIFGTGLMLHKRARQQLAEQM